MEGVVSGFWPQFWRGRRVLVTGHTGFKGTWLCAVLRHLGAEVCGVALAAEEDSLYGLLAPMDGVESFLADIRDRDAVGRVVNAFRPEIILHLAAQSLVRRSFDDPFETFDVNVRGSLCVLEAVAACPAPPCVLVVTSDKVYGNDNGGGAFREDDPLGGDDPYSASKAACEIAVRSFAAARGLRLCTARAGNVVGGGDFGQDRLLPDVYRAFAGGGVLTLRHPEATRPWQHVLDVVYSYLRYAQAMIKAPETTPKALNIGPEGPAMNVGQAVGIFQTALGRAVDSTTVPDASRPEKTRLELDTTLGRERLGLRNRLSQDEAVRWAGIWYRDWHAGGDPAVLLGAQIAAYEEVHGSV